VAERRSVAKRQVIDPEERRWRRVYPAFPGVATCVALLRRPNVRGTWVDIIRAELTAHAGEGLGELVAEFRRPENDARVRALIVAAIADAAAPSAVPFLTGCLADPDEHVRHWAADGLRRIGTKAARTALWQADPSGEPTLGG
jgi:HEAT repeat protein